jgi:two-component system, NtrC family, response regulator AtoC
LAKLHPELVMKLLLIDDEDVIHKSVGGFLSKLGYEVLHAHEGEEGLKIFRSESIDVVVSDIKMPGMDGLALLSAIVQEDQQAEVILMTGHGDLNMAVDALRNGAFDFFRKPVVLDELLACLQRTKKYREMREEKNRIQKRLTALLHTESPLGRYEILGESTAIKKVQALIDKVASAEKTTVLIQGESGTGKELVAHAIHQRSVRKEAAFMSVNCTAIPETLLESELFGHEKGAFTDARLSRSGVFELADGGSLFLDEIGDMNLSAQAKILRVLEERQVRRVGGAREISVDVRLITATNKNLKQMVKDKIFREDLFFRLNVFAIALPPLRERGDDVLLLAYYFLKQFALDMGKDITGMVQSVEHKLKKYPFPGNIRELRNLVERAVILCDENHLTEADFPDLDGSIQLEGDDLFLSNDMPLDLEALERYAIVRALKLSHGNQTEASKHLGIGHDALRYRIKKLGIDV